MFNRFIDYSTKINKHFLNIYTVLLAAIAIVSINFSSRFISYVLHVKLVLHIGFAMKDTFDYMHLQLSEARASLELSISFDEKT